MSLPDLEKYRPYAANFDMTDEQKDEFLLTMWEIMGSFVDKAFGIHPMQLCQKNSIAPDLTNDNHVKGVMLSDGRK